MLLPSDKTVNSNTPIYPNSNFTWGEATKNCTRPVEDLVIDGQTIITAAGIELMIIHTAKNMDAIRKLLGNKPIKVTSWYRPKDVNQRVKGSKYSRHQYGDAVDWVCGHLNPWQIARKLEPNHNEGGYKAYKHFTHTDWRGFKARW